MADDSTTPWYLSEVLEEIERERMLMISQSATDNELIVSTTSNADEGDSSQDPTTTTELTEKASSQNVRRYEFDIPRSYHDDEDENSEFELIFRPYHGPLHFHDEDQEAVTGHNDNKSDNNVESFLSFFSRCNFESMGYVCEGTKGIATATILIFSLLMLRHRDRRIEGNITQQQKIRKRKLLSGDQADDGISQRGSKSPKKNHLDSYDEARASVRCISSTYNANRKTRHPDKHDIPPPLEEEVQYFEHDVNLPEMNECEQSDVDQEPIEAKITFNENPIENFTQYDSNIMPCPAEGEEFIKTSERQETLTSETAHCGLRSKNKFTGGVENEGKRLLPKGGSKTNSSNVSSLIRQTQRQEETILFNPSTSYSDSSSISFTKQVHMIASTVSSTGLSRQESLKLANEVVIRRLEYQFESKEREKQNQIRSLIEEWEHGVDRLKRLRFQMFPGSLFCNCTLSSLLSRVIWRHKYIILKFLFHDNNSQSLTSMALDLMDAACSCAILPSGEDTGISKSATSSLFSVDSLTRQLSSISIYQGLQHTLSSFHIHSQLVLCRSMCTTQLVILPLLLLHMAHRFLGVFRCREELHMILNSSFTWLWVLPKLLGTRIDPLMSSSDVTSSRFSLISLSTQLLHMHLLGLVLLHMAAAGSLHLVLTRWYNTVYKPRDIHASTISISKIIRVVKYSAYFASILYGMLLASFTL